MITNAIDAVKEFNKAFKIETSMTPTEYIKNLQSFWFYKSQIYIIYYNNILSNSKMGRHQG